MPGRKKKDCYTRDFNEDVSFEQEGKEASELYAHMKTHPDWNEDGIAIFLHKDGLFLMDCNADTATVYRRDSVDDKFYTGHDGFYVFIDNVAYAEEWFRDEFMKTYKASFGGRLSGAIGIFYLIEDTVEGENEEKARLNLYNKYEHIQGLTLEEVTE